MLNKLKSVHRIAAAALVAVLMLGVIVTGYEGQVYASPRFSDVPTTHWAYDAIEYAADKGLFSGTSETTFSPEGNMTRGMLWVVLARMDGVDVSGGSPWYQKGLDWAKTNGISDGTYPDNNITREQFASMLYRFAEHSGVSTATNANALSGYTDKSSVASYAITPMSWAVTNGIISGTTTTTVSPQGNATRAQVAMMLMRYDQQFGTGEQPVEEYTFSLATERQEVKVGTELRGYCNVVPYSYTSGLTVEFKSSDTSIATVKKDTSSSMHSCIITAVGPGTVTITATDSNGKTAEWEITVTGDSTVKPSESSNPNVVTGENAEIRQKIVELTNEVRAEAGVGALTVDAKLMEAAQIRANECAEMGSLNSHMRPNGDPGGFVLRDVGYDYLGCGENLILMSGTQNTDYASRAISSWINSSGHYKVMTNSERTEIGVGLVMDGNKVYCCMIAATPRSE